MFSNKTNVVPSVNRRNWSNFLSIAEKMTALPRPRHILQLTAAEKSEFLNSFDYVFSDMDGVLWNQASKIDNAVGGYKALMNAGKSLHFVTNNSIRTNSQYEEKLKAYGFEFDLQNLWHPARSLAAYLKSVNFDGLLYVIGASNLKNTLREAGFKLIDGPTKIINEDFQSFMQEVYDSQPVAAVIISFDYNLNAAKLIRAQMYLKRPNVQLLIGATDMFLPLGNGISLLGPGQFSKIVIDACDKQPLTLGKPGKQLADILVKELQIPERKRVLMIGDMLEQDIAFGNVAGFQTLLVLSGGCSLKEMRENTKEHLNANYYADSVKDFIEFMRDLKG